MATYVITVGSTLTTVLLGSLNINETANGANTASFTVESATGAYRPALNEIVAITEDATVIFAGFVKSVSEAGFGGIGWGDIASNIQCEDYNGYASRMYVSGTVAAGDLEDALIVIAAALGEYDVELSLSQPTGPPLDAIIYDYMKVSEALDQLYELTGYMWDIGYDHYLSMVVPGTVSAPFNITAGDGHCLGDVTVEVSMEDYANKVVVRFTDAAVAAWGFLNPSIIANGETVTIGSVTYTWDTTLTNTSNHVKIGGTIAASMNNLIQALDAAAGGAGEGTNWGTGTTANSTVFGYIINTDILVAKARETGANGNTIAVSETMAKAAWYWEGNQLITTLDGGLDEALTNTAWAEDSGEQVVMDLWETVVDRAEIRDLATAQALADKLLTNAVGAKTKKTVHYTTDFVDDPTLHPGQKQTITLPLRNLSGNFLITDVRVFEASNWLRREVTLQGGTTLLNRWQDDAKKALGGTSSAAAVISLSGATGGTTGGGTAPVGTTVPSPTWMGGGEVARTRCASSANWYRGFNGVEVIIDSTKVDPNLSPSLSIKMLGDAITGGNAQCRLVATQNDWASVTVCTPACTPVTSGTVWTWQGLAITIQTGVWAYRIEMKSSVNNSDVGFRAIWQW